MVGPRVAFFWAMRFDTDEYHSDRALIRCSGGIDTRGFERLCGQSIKCQLSCKTKKVDGGLPTAANAIQLNINIYLSYDPTRSDPTRPDPIRDPQGIEHQTIAVSVSVWKYVSV